MRSRICEWTLLCFLHIEAAPHRGFPKLSSYPHYISKGGEGFSSDTAR